MSCHKYTISEYSSSESTSHERDRSPSQLSLERYTEVMKTKELMTMDTDDVQFEIRDSRNSFPYTVSSLLIPTEKALGRSGQQVAVQPVQSPFLFPSLHVPNSAGTSFRPPMYLASGQSNVPAGKQEELPWECNSTELTTLAGSRPTTADSVLVAVTMRAEMQLQQQQEDDQSGQWDASYSIFQMDLEDSDGRMHGLTGLPTTPPECRHQRPVLPHFPKHNPTQRLPPHSPTSHGISNRNVNASLSPQLSPAPSDLSLPPPLLPSTLYPLLELSPSMQAFTPSVPPSIQSFAPKSQMTKPLRTPIFVPPPTSPVAPSMKSICSTSTDAKARLEKKYQEIMGIMIGLQDVMASKALKLQRKKTSLPSTPEDLDLRAPTPKSEGPSEVPSEVASETSSVAEAPSAQALAPSRPTSLPAKRAVLQPQQAPRPASDIAGRAKAEPSPQTEDKNWVRSNWMYLWDIIQDRERSMSWTSRMCRMAMWMGWVLWMVMALRASCVEQERTTQWLPSFGVQEILCLLEVLGLLEVLWLLQNFSVPVSATSRPIELADASTMTKSNVPTKHYESLCY